jgi:hypothetical protein
MPITVYKNSILDMSKWDGVDPTGVNDSNDPADTLGGALNAAMDYASKNQLIGWLPSGSSYLVSGVINGMAPWGAQKHTANNCWRLMGEIGNGARPIIKSVSGFAPDAGAIKAIIRCGMWASGSTTVENPDNSYGGVLRNIEVRLDPTNNAKGICIHLFSAQHWSFDNVKMVATGGYAGLAGGTGPGAFSCGIEVVGGQYGILNGPGVDQTATSGAAYFYRDIKLSGQTVHAFWHKGYRGCTMVGAQIDNAPAVAIRQADYPTPSRGALVLKDVMCEWTGAAGTFVRNNETDKVLVMSGCYLKNCATVIDVTGTDVVNTSSGVVIDEIIKADGTYTPGTTYTTGHDAAAGITSITAKKLSNGVVTNGPVVGITKSAVSSIPAALVTRWKRWKDKDLLSSDVIDAVVEYSVVPDSPTQDSTPTIQAALDAAATLATSTGRPWGVGLRKGTYYLNSRLTIKGDVYLFGCAGRQSVLYANSAWASGLTEKDWIVWTDDDIYGEAKLYDLVITFASPWNKTSASHLLGAVHWRQGRNSGSHTNKAGQWSAAGERSPRQMYRFSGPNASDGFLGNAGGDHLCIVDHAQAMPADDGLNSSGYRKVVINGTTEPLHIGQLNCEHGGVATDRNAPFVSIIGAANVEIDQCKFEQVGPPIEILPGGVSGNVAPDVRIDYFGAWTPGGISAPDTNTLLVTAPAQVEVNYIWSPLRSAVTAPTTYGKLVLETGFGTVATVTRENLIAEYLRRTSGRFDREAMFNTTSRPPAEDANFDPTAVASTVWFLWLEGMDPNATDLAIAELEASQLVGGGDILSDATITAGGGSSGVTALTDADAATNFTATDGVVIKIVFSDAKTLKEIRVKAPVSVAPPTACEVWCYDDGLGRPRKLRSTVWASFTPSEVKAVRFNTRGRLAGMTQRAFSELF